MARLLIHPRGAALRRVGLLVLAWDLAGALVPVAAVAAAGAALLLGSSIKYADQWEKAVVLRLARSATKLSQPFTPADWGALAAGYGDAWPLDRFLG